LPPPPQPSATAIERLGKLKLPDLDGNRQSVEQWRGKIIVVNFWATWCPPCKAEIPEFARISVDYALKNVQFVGISADSPDEVRAFKRDTLIPYPTLIGDSELPPLLSDLGNPANGLPFTVILRQDGTLYQTKLGALKGPELEQILTQVLSKHEM
jgi:thiol-disulfide isomerase/thioredoxin